MLKNVFKLSFVLFTITLLAALALSQINLLTKDRIATIKIENKENAIRFVLRDFTFDFEHPRKVKLDEEKETVVWEGKNNDGIIKGYAFVTSKYGYSSNVQTMVGIDTEGKILAIMILSQMETPGLGARCEEVATTETFWMWIAGKTEKNIESAKTIPWFQTQFTGRTVGKPIGIEKGGAEFTSLSAGQRKSLLEQNGVTSLAGATITTQAIVGAINEVGGKILKQLALPGEENQLKIKN